MNGATTFSIMTQHNVMQHNDIIIMICSIMTCSITVFSMTTLSIMTVNAYAKLYNTKLLFVSEARSLP